MSISTLLRLIYIYTHVIYFETHFSYRQAQAAVLFGLEKLKKLKIPTQRPNDYYAEMAKSDAHMKKV